jgi:hypothetical protein
MQKLNQLILRLIMTPTRNFWSPLELLPDFIVSLPLKKIGNSGCIVLNN